MSTPNGFDERWIEAINHVMEDRESPVRIIDLDSELWDRYIGPMCDAVEEGCVSATSDVQLDLTIYSFAPCDEHQPEQKVGFVVCSRCGLEL